VSHVCAHSHDPAQIARSGNALLARSRTERRQGLPWLLHDRRYVPLPLQAHEPKSVRVLVVPPCLIQDACGLVPSRQRSVGSHE
jgi:hypothetical protein